MFHVVHLERSVGNIRYLLDIGGGAGRLDCAGACWSSSQERCRGVRTERRRTGATVLGRRDSTDGVVLPPPFNCRRGQRGYKYYQRCNMQCGEKW